MARLRIEPRPPEYYMPGALPLSYLALGDQVGLLIMSLCDRLYLQHDLHGVCNKVLLWMKDHPYIRKVIWMKTRWIKAYASL
jgi:hypothetical protein